MPLEPSYQGYIIANEAGAVVETTLRSSRRKCWDAFVQRGARVEYVKRKKELQRQGFRAVKVALLQVE